MPHPIVHAGLHKTGSTSIQVALKHSTTACRRGLLVPVEGGIQSEEEWLKLFQRLAMTSQGILSDENFLGSPFDAYAKASQRIKALKGVMHGRSVSFVVYVRPQPQWLQSLYLQGVQEGNPQSPDEFLSQILSAPHLRWSTLGSVIQREFGSGNLDLRAYDSRDAVADFFLSQRLGSPPRFPQNGLRINRSIAPIQGPILRNLLSDPELDFDGKVRIRRFFQQELSAGAPVGYSSFSETQQRAMRSIMVEDTASLVAGELMLPQASEVYGQNVANLQSEPLLPWAESSESAEVLGLEALRCARLLADNRAGKDTALRRVLDLIRADPLAIPYSLGRKLRRLI